MITTNKTSVKCVNCGEKIEIEKGRGVCKSSVPVKQRNYLCGKCWDRIGKVSFSIYE